MTTRGVLAVLLLVTRAALLAQDREDRPKPQKNLPLKSERSIEFDTDEGTWLSLDVSPDGKTIIFELLGRLYTLPMAGGEAKPLLTGMAMETQPRYSPDGKQIAFFSDRDGAENVWVMNADGSNPRNLSDERRASLLRQPGLRMASSSRSQSRAVTWGRTNCGCTTRMAVVLECR